MTEEAPTLETLESESVADTLSSVMDEAGMETTDPVFDTINETLETSEIVQPEEPAEEAAEKTAEETRLRDEKGRFAAAKTEEDEAVPPNRGNETEKILEPRPEWSAEQHEMFLALDDNAKEFLLSRVTEADTKAQESQSIAEKYTGVESVLAENRVAWAAKGLDDAGAIRALATLSNAADNNPVEFIKWFAEGRGINLGELAGVNAEPPSGDDDDIYADPEVTALKQSNQRLEQELLQIKNHLEQQSLQQTSVTENQLSAEIDQFRAATTESGEQAHPYFNQVEDLMADLITAAHRKGQEMTLEKAYHSACRADDDISAKMEASRKAKEARTQGVKRREKSLAATRAGSSVSGRPVANEQHTSDSLADQLRSEFDSRGLLDQPLI